MSNIKLNAKDFSSVTFVFLENMKLCSTNIMCFVLQRFIFHYKLLVHLSYFSETITWCHLKHLFLRIDIYSHSCLNPLSTERKSMLKSGDSRAVWTWLLKMSPASFARHYIRKALLTSLIILPMLLFAEKLRMVITSWWRSKIYSRRLIVKRNQV